MSAGETLVYVIDDTSNNRPYTRVVGARNAEGSVDWVPTEGLDGVDRAYEPNDAEERKIPVVPEMADHLPSFIRTFMGEQRVYDCHTFAFSMLGRQTDHLRAPEEARALVAGEQAWTGRLSLGQVGTLGGVEGRALNPFPDHSMVGLGDDSHECLEVMGVGGNIGITSFDAIFDRFTGGMNMLRLVNTYKYNIYIPSDPQQY